MSLSKSVLQKAIAENGFYVVENVIDFNDINLLIQKIALAKNSTFAKQRHRSVYAIRNALLIREIYSLALSQPIVSLANAVLNADARPVKAFLFDKTPQANWKVAWHQDLTIAVKKRQPTTGFSGWSEKAGIVHVQPLIEILENLLTLRIHLDNCDRSNGALKIIPGSHRHGKIASTDIERVKKSSQIHTCEMQQRRHFTDAPFAVA